MRACTHVYTDGSCTNIVDPFWSKVKRWDFWVVHLLFTFLFFVFCVLVFMLIVWLVIVLILGSSFRSDGRGIHSVLSILSWIKYGFSYQVVILCYYSWSYAQLSVIACTGCIQWIHIALTFVNMHRLMNSMTLVAFAANLIMLWSHIEEFQFLHSA